MRLRLKFTKPSYDEIRDDALQLFKFIRRSGWSPDVNVGVGRGGLFVLRCLQDFYVAGGVKIPYIVPMVERYNGIASASSIRVRGLSRRGLEGRKVLLVDDVSDQGDSLLALRAIAKRRGASDVKTATIHYKPWSKLKPDFYVSETDAWIIYPWEVHESIRLILERSREATDREAFHELRDEADVTKKEYLAFCALATHSSAVPEDLVKRVKAVCGLYRGTSR
jgi:hypoxanthine phosphoribosyltransferase